MSDLPPLPKVYVVAPTYAIANAYAKEHGLARRRMHVVCDSESLERVTGTVYLCWPPSRADPDYIVERVLTDPTITVAPCRSWDEATGTSSEAVLP